MPRKLLAVLAALTLTLGTVVGAAAAPGTGATVDRITLENETSTFIDSLFCPDPDVLYTVTFVASGFLQATVRPDGDGSIHGIVRGTVRLTPLAGGTSYTGTFHRRFSVNLSETRGGETLHIRLTGDDGSTIVVNALFKVRNGVNLDPHIVCRSR